MTNPLEPARNDDADGRDDRCASSVDGRPDDRADDGLAPLIANTGDDDDGAPTG